jgi:hypothetical protein
LLFKKLATLISDAPVIQDLEALRWRGPPPLLCDSREKIDAKLVARAERLRL